MLSITTRLAFALMLTAVPHASQANTAPNPNPMTANDVVGMFADIGVEGIYKGTRTVTEAHGICLKETSIGSEVSNAVDGDYHSAYKTCMAQYVPFKISGVDLAGSCASQTVSWGQCQATVPASPEGASVSAQNKVDTQNFEGYATFQCTAGSLSFVSGGCSRAVKECADGQIVNWPVTTPLWADESSVTPYIDKYGEPVHKPKSRCYARMPSATSGELHNPTPTVPEMMEPERYNMPGSTSPQRCFDSKWLAEQGSGTTVCEYIPKNCEAQTISHNGCTFSLPAANHDTVHSDNKPSPFNSIGSVEGYCFDGEWKIKARSCALSCGATIDPYSWKGSDANRACQHDGLSPTERVTPGMNIVIPNKVDGMLGSVTYRCQNGSFNNISEPCEPKGCTDGIAAHSWTGADGSQCQHNAISGSQWQNGQTAIVSSNSDPFSASGWASYTCQYGEMTIQPGLSECSTTGGPLCDMTTPPKTCENGRDIDGKCCEVVDGTLLCGKIFVSNPEEEGFTPSLRYSGSCMHCTGPLTDGTGKMHPYPEIKSRIDARNISAGVSVFVDSGCSNATDCKVEAIAGASGTISGSFLPSQLSRTDNLSTGGTLTFTLDVYCDAYSAAWSNYFEQGTIRVTHKVTGIVKTLTYDIDVTPSCSANYQIGI